MEVIPGLLGSTEEQSPTYMLLSSPNIDLSHPLALQPLTPSEYERGPQTPSSVGTEMSTVPPDILPANDRKDCDPREEKESQTSSSSSCVIQEAASAQLLHSYFPADHQEKVGVRTGGSLSHEYSFVSWNWPAIRLWCFWTVVVGTVACACAVAGLLGTVPRRCDPAHTWYQGALLYRIFVPSFQDSDADGIGDLRGVAARLPYIKDLGATGIMLSHVFPSHHYPDHFTAPTSLSALAIPLGSPDEFRRLARLIHANNMTLVLDLPLYYFYQKLNSVNHVIVNNHILAQINKNRSLITDESKIKTIFQFWMEIGVDGFFLDGLEELVEDSNLDKRLHEWRSIVGHRMLGCNIEAARHSTTILKAVDLLEFRIHPDSLLVDLADPLLQKLQTTPGLPWPLYSFSGPEDPRLASRLPLINMTLAVTVLSFLLPGSNVILYGDEIGLHSSSHYEMELPRQDGVAVMTWPASGRSFSQPGVLPWRAAGQASSPLGPQIIHYLSELRQQSPALYMQAVWASGHLHRNTNIKSLGHGVISIERSYPRRNTFLFLVNLGMRTVTKDLSGLHFGGTSLLDQKGPHHRYTKFYNLSFNPGDFLLVKLDK